jgi:hypothetical protein
MASAITGSSTSFFKQLIREKKLTRYKINTATFISLLEFEKLAVAQTNNLYRGNKEGDHFSIKEHRITTR